MRARAFSECAFVRFCARLCAFMLFSCARAWHRARQLPAQHFVRIDDDDDDDDYEFRAPLALVGDAARSEHSRTKVVTHHLARRLARRGCLRARKIARAANRGDKLRVRKRITHAGPHETEAGPSHALSSSLAIRRNLCARGKLTKPLASAAPQPEDGLDSSWPAARGQSPLEHFRLLSRARVACPFLAVASDMRKR